ncbi:suppressor of tumorigenicity 14 protein homolog [Sinocyclocheilus rhinocerous]|uniref:Suppressor of tumorigenicity 14 protein homolog n=1 Tax=Sinocyclocheilus rhinocerous TaxID=307959 RepID=A0A673L145_9TELE|nr:PREDICTED: suppressor of tumorigenicity 14 protein homolog [Sinocyclocheilus rhinocerous]XP_016375882.1 PREDICTED: suppressor of tumorigenicity 14 protein homolog [Sinocyclocheilus rhinocerous]XP_016375883.1 PREDICTED: suppressor of tumorigenicity 14 protein homolog [Sinocyclocheilus rhinocerous]XP_016375884.1 PREDICTED: suppressor of tumorigenicity 14 protein homolog [Sinocyclocheilus rhinocerous]
MDPMDQGMRYTPGTSDKDWEQAVTFLPASDNKKLEKKRGPGKVGIIVALVILAAILALIIGLLVWHFHFRKDLKSQRIYTGSLRITNQAFVDAYENPDSAEFKDLANQVMAQLKSMYSESPQLSKYYVGSKVQAFSEGSVIAYYESEFAVPAAQEAAVDQAVNSLSGMYSTKVRRVGEKQGPLVFDHVVSSALDTRLFSKARTSIKYAQHAKSSAEEIITSPGFPDKPYAPNSFVQWQLRGDPGHMLKLSFDTFNLEEDCSNDFVRVYDSLVAMDKHLMEEECGFYSPSNPLTFISSRNVMLVTLVTNEEGNFPGFRARVTQISQDSSELACGGKLSGTSGSFKSPNFPSYYPPNTTCQWDIEVPDGKYVKLRFPKFMVSTGSLNHCSGDYVQIVGKSTLCGQQPANTMVTVNSNKMTVVFKSDSSQVDRGFSATYEVFEPTDPCPDKFQCDNKRCVNPSFRCDGWNDCGDSTDERNCKCDASMIQCRNGVCKPMLWRCDGVNDCGDDTDELNCGCKTGEFKCNDNQCVSEKMKCDGNRDCKDGSDEDGCSRDICKDSTFMCGNGKCITKPNPMCDGQDDCDDGSDESNCNCGKKAYTKSRIVGGQEADVGEFPWQVSLHVKNTAHVCGASIISEQWLVTAAHCVQDDAKIKYSQPGTWEAYLGLHTQREKQKATKKLLKQIIPHKNYNSHTYDNDIALMELDSPVTFSATIRPICLPTATDVFPAGETVTISGWGATREGGSGATVLQKANVRIINSTVCDELMNGQITSRMTCAGVLSGGVDACQGDSGGPMTILSNERMYLAGVVSWGDGCARKDKPGIYTNMPKFRAWIKEKTGV